MIMMFLKVVMTLAPGGLEEGQGFEFSGDLPWELGRAPLDGPELRDRSISRRHALITRDAQDKWWIENISKHNGVFVDGEEVTPGARHMLPHDLFHLQLGSVVFELKWLQETQPFTLAIKPPGVTSPLTQAALVREETEAFSSSALGLDAPSKEEDAMPWFDIVRDGDCCTVHCKGRLVTMKPSCALALYALCQKPGEVVHGWDVLDVMGGEYDLPQAISGLRRRLREVIEQGWLSREEIVHAIASTSAQWSTRDLFELDEAALLRKLVLSRRGHGYVLLVPPEKIALALEG